MCHIIRCECRQLISDDLPLECPPALPVIVRVNFRSHWAMKTVAAKIILGWTIGAIGV